MAAAPLAVGDILPPLEVRVTPERQARYHAGAGIDPALYGGLADVSVLANDTIHATRHLNRAGGSGLQLVGLHLGQRMTQSEPVHLDEPLSAEGRVTAVGAAARGTRISFAFDFRRNDRSVPLTSELHSLRVDAATMRQLGAAAPEAFDATGYASAMRVVLTPGRVADYSAEFPDYRVHFDRAVARNIGLRVPVAQGLMSLTWMLAVLAQRGVPRELDLAAQFRRPVNWDEIVEVLAKGESELRVVGADSTLRSLGRVSHLAR